MMLQGLGAVMLARLMRLERIAECDSSWMLHGPGDEPAWIEDEIEELAPAMRFAAE